MHFSEDKPVCIKVMYQKKLYEFKKGSGDGPVGSDRRSTLKVNKCVR